MTIHSKVSHMSSASMGFQCCWARSRRSNAKQSKSWMSARTRSSLAAYSTVRARRPRRSSITMEATSLSQEMALARVCHGVATPKGRRTTPPTPAHRYREGLAVQRHAAPETGHPLVPQFLVGCDKRLLTGAQHLELKVLRLQQALGAGRLPIEERLHVAVEGRNRT